MVLTSRALAVVGEEWPRRQARRVDVELAHARQEVGQADELGNILVRRGRRRLGHLLRGGGQREAKGGGNGERAEHTDTSDGRRRMRRYPLDASRAKKVPAGWRTKDEA